MDILINNENISLIFFIHYNIPVINIIYQKSIITEKLLIENYIFN